MAKDKNTPPKSTSGQQIKKINEGYQPTKSIDPTNPPKGKKGGNTQGKKG